MNVCTTELGIVIGIGNKTIFDLTKKCSFMILVTGNSLFRVLRIVIPGTSLGLTSPIPYFIIFIEQISFQKKFE